jgi:hypothetical protein
MSDNHKLTFDLKVTPSFNAEDQVLQFETSSHTQVLSREVIRFKEETTRKALIELGWTPPSERGYIKQRADAISIVHRLAEWSKKYPRQRIHSFSEKMDEQLIEIEEAAKAFMSNA